MTKTQQQGKKTNQQKQNERKQHTATKHSATKKENIFFLKKQDCLNFFEKKNSQKRKNLSSFSVYLLIL